MTTPQGDPSHLGRWIGGPALAVLAGIFTVWLAGIKDVFANVGKKATDARDSKEGSLDACLCSVFAGLARAAG